MHSSNNIQKMILMFLFIMYDNYMIYYNKKNQVIVIGSGAAGLSTAVSLAKAGKQVKVLEQNVSPGGKLNNTREGKWSFNSGYHHLSSMNSSSNTLFSNLTGKRLNLKGSNKICERVIFKDGATYDILSNREKFLSRLKNDFPGEIIGLVSFYKEIDHVIEHNKILLKPRLTRGLQHHLSRMKSNIKFGNIKNLTLEDLLDKHLRDNKLKIILSLHCGKLLTPPKDTPFSYYSIINSSYFDGEAHLAENTASVIEALVNELLENGGEIEYGKKVDSLIIEKNKIGGVKLSCGESIICRSIVSSIGINRTYEDLIVEFSSSRRYSVLNDNIDNKRSYIKMNIGFDCSLSELGIDSLTYRILSKNPYDFDNNPGKAGYTPNHTIITFPSVDGAAVSQVFIPVNCKYFTDTQEYTKLEEDLTNTLLDIFEKQFPGISENIVYTNLSIPLASRDFCFASVISEKVSDQVFHPVSDISGLYFTGEDILTHGITGTCIGGIITASNVAKKNLIKVFE